ncbi:MAG TPA: Rid family hydrolase [Gaiellaceae bacterium]|jgi:2-iminobutanoate/2-iminopropanoate deaminase|nr:Rid family hydrolase [Gaiellaceae bacterium]
MKAVISSKRAAPAAGAYSPALLVDGWLFLSGQGGFDPATGELAGDDIESQVEQTLSNIDALLEEAGLDRTDVVSCVAHLSDLSLFPRFNAAYAEGFAEPRPVRTTVEAKLVAGMLVELTVVARQGAGA